MPRLFDSVLRGMHWPKRRGNSNSNPQAVVPIEGRVVQVVGIGAATTEGGEAGSLVSIGSLAACFAALLRCHHD